MSTLFSEILFLLKCLFVAFFIFSPNLGLLVKRFIRNLSNLYIRDFLCLLNHIFRGVFGTYSVEDPFCTVIGIGHIL